MSCRVIVTKSLPKQMLTYGQFDPREHEIEPKYIFIEQNTYENVVWIMAAFYQEFMY